MSQPRVLDDSTVDEESRGIDDSDGTKSKGTFAAICGDRGHARKRCPQRDEKQAREPLTEHLFDDDLHRSHGVQEKDETRKFYSKEFYLMKRVIIRVQEKRRDKEVLLETVVLYVT